MKKVTKFLTAVLFVGMCSFGYAQNQPDYMKAPKPDEKIIGSLNNYKTSKTCNASQHLLDREIYERALTHARERYSNYAWIDLRNVKIVTNADTGYSDNDMILVGDEYRFIDRATLNCAVVTKLSQGELLKTKLSQAMKKALRDVPEGARLAIDRITSDNDEIDRETLKDQVTDMLLDKGYRIVAKEYFAKLYEEQQAQQSGIYNERTTVQENNFSAVGYYINVKVTETSVRVQVVNVSTGEYEGNATVNF